MSQTRLRVCTAALLVAGVALFHACSGADKKKDSKGAADAGPAKTASSTLGDLAENVWLFGLRENPEGATILGIHDHDDKLTDLTEEGRNRRVAQAKSFQDAAEAIDAQKLTGEERITRDLIIHEMKDLQKAHELQMHLWAALDQLDGPQAGGFALTTRKFHPRKTVKDIENLTARYVAFGPFMDAYLANLQAGLAKQMAAPVVVAQRVIEQLRELTSESLEKSSFLAGPLPDGLSEEEKKRLTDGLTAAVKDVVLPSYVKLKDYLEGEYLLSARSDVGIKFVANGEAIYAWLIEHHTTRTMTADDVHALGLKELALVEGEMMQIALSQKHKKGKPLSDFNDKLKKDKKNFAKDKTELMNFYKAALDRARAKAPEAFEKLPKVDVEVVEIDSTRAPSSPAGMYQDADMDSTRKAQFEANMYKAETRPLYNAEALVFHESIPGHHVQGGLAHDLEGLPKIRRVAWFSAFGEGWALYSEKLADELGLYSSPLARYGYLSARAWRAVRLVVDTGIHAQGWDRQKALDFMKAHTTLAPADLENELDRYILWPGQALSYLVGALEIEALRKEAQDKLGDKFDRKKFHTAVLGSGCVPLDVLRANVTAYTTEASAPPPAATPPTTDGGAPPAASPDGGTTSVDAGPAPKK